MDKEDMMCGNMYDLAVAYRVCPKISKSKSPLYPDDKFKLTEYCFRSFVDAVQGLRVKLFLLLDNCPPEYEEMFRRIWWPEFVEVISYNGITIQKAFQEQIRILSEQNFASYVYFAEDDYYYLPSAITKAVAFMEKNNSVAFVSCYEHPDMYNTELHSYMLRSSEDYINATDGFRLCCSTTHTFLTHKCILADTKWIWNRTKWWIADLAQWMAITKRPKISLWTWLRWCFGEGIGHEGESYWAFCYLVSWYCYFYQRIIPKRYKLVVASPSLATHMVEKYLPNGFVFKTS